jgi:DNA processing protein
MNYSENALKILTLKQYKGIGKAWIVKNYKENLPLDSILNLLNKDSKETLPITLEDFEIDKRNMRNEIERFSDSIDGIVAFGDRDFPPSRGKVKNSEQPIVLFYKGDLSLLSFTQKNVAVIGLLTPDQHTISHEKMVVHELVSHNVSIVSGLALGCDTIAHQATLELKGKTVAILPSSLSNIMPATNQGLAQEILATGGLLITEYHLEPKSKMELNGRYQERDRLQALFSDFIILAASYAKNDIGNDSGSRLAMEYAANYSIPRGVIYDENLDANNPKYDLNRQIINEGNGVLVFTPDNYVSMVNKVLEINHNVTQQFVQTNLFE